jgi:alpha-methylacyl-CoA racemase
MQPLHGITVLDFSTLLPGPLATLLLAEAGARVIKVERPGNGDEMRSYTPKFGKDSVNFALLNRGKESVAIDLKSASERGRLEDLLRNADVIVEQFRPGVMRRLGLDYETVARINPKIIYCSITGYGQTGPKAQTAAHDLNYVADSGMLALSAGAQGAPVLPAALVADIGGGAYPAVMNILLALQARGQGGTGCHLDISMADNLFTFMYWGLGNGWSTGQWPQRGKELVTGGTARYQIYRTSDNRYLAAAPLEDKFWRNFTEIIGVSELELAADDEQAIATVAAAIAQHPASYWLEKCKDREACTGLVADLEDAVADAHFVERGVFTHTLEGGEAGSIPALPVPICSAFRQTNAAAAPQLGQSNATLIRKM